MTTTSTIRRAGFALALTAGALGLALPAHAQYRQEVAHDPAKCRGSGPAVNVAVTGIKSSTGKLRVQLYRATKQDWLEKGRWIHRIELAARAGTMTVCMPVPEAGTYGIAVRHDVNGNDETDITQDGGGASNNPSFNIFNLGKPSYTKVGFAVGSSVKAISVKMHYL